MRSTSATVAYDFTAETEEEISLTAGTVVEVIVFEEDGWCTVKHGESTGLFPPDYLIMANAAEDEEYADVDSDEQEENNNSNENDEDDNNDVQPESENEPEPTPLSKEEARAKHRINVIKEVKLTEEDYVKDLEIVSKVFIQPLNSQSIITREESTALFSNIGVLLHVNTQLNELLQAEPTDEYGLMVGKIFIEMAEFLKVYTEYCSNQPKSMATLERLNLQPNFKAFLAACMENPDCRGLTLFSFLIKPIQRICKYPLLLKDLLAHTDEPHADYENLKTAMQKIETVVEYVNERKRLAENLQKILDVQDQIESTEELNLVSPSRRFVREGAFKVIEKGKPRDRNVYLFNDLILITKPKKNMIMTGMKKDHFKYQLSLNQARVTDVADTATIQNACEICPLATTNRDKQAYTIIFSTVQEKQAWVREIKALVKEFQKKQYQAQLKASKEGSTDVLMGGATPPSVTPEDTGSPVQKRNKITKSASRREKSLSLTGKRLSLLPGSSSSSANNSANNSPTPSPGGASPAPENKPSRSFRSSILGGAPTLPANKSVSDKNKKQLKKQIEKGNKKSPMVPMPGVLPPTKGLVKTANPPASKAAPGKSPKPPPRGAASPMSSAFNSQLASALANRRQE